MSTLDLPAVSDYERHEVARHLEQTYSMNYGSQERIEALYFRLPQGDPAVVRNEPCPAFLRELAAAVRAGAAKIRIPHLSKPDRYRMSELLRQSAARPAREGTPGAAALARLVRDFDDATRITGTDEDTRAEYIALPRSVSI